MAAVAREAEQLRQAEAARRQLSDAQQVLIAEDARLQHVAAQQQQTAIRFATERQVLWDEAERHRHELEAQHQEAQRQLEAQFTQAAMNARAELDRRVELQLANERAAEARIQEAQGLVGAAYEATTARA